MDTSEKEATVSKTNKKKSSESAVEIRYIPGIEFSDAIPYNPTQEK